MRARVWQFECILRRGWWEGVLTVCWRDALVERMVGKMLEYLLPDGEDLDAS